MKILRAPVVLFLLLHMLATPFLQAAPALTEEQKARHVLDRLGYGPRPGDAEKVLAMGVTAYIRTQLQPGPAAQPDLDERLATFKTLSMTPGELVRAYPPPQIQRRLQQAGGMMEPASESTQKPREIQLELQEAKLLRAVYGANQLQEVMTDFWWNHFNVFMGKGADRYLTSDYENRVIRPHALGRFRDLLQATAESPAMLFYLDNWMSSDPDARPPVNARRPAQSPALPAARRGLNENYARELMELHTLGVDGGYTQKDVTEVARCFTGWTLRRPQQGGGFFFDRRLHDPGVKIVLGRKIAAGGGMDDGLQVLDLLAQHPSTARFIAAKLARRFVSDHPPERLVERLAETFRKTQGDIRQVLTTLFASQEFFAPEAYRAKVKKPFDLVASALRVTGADVQTARALVNLVARMGEPLYLCQPPTGYADTAETWINTGALLNRINFATALSANRIRGVRLSTAEIGAMPVKTVLNNDISETTRRALEGDTSNGPETRIGLLLGSPEFQRR